MSKSFDVCIRGDGVVGRTLALLLAGQRLRVALVGRPERLDASPADDVRAYALNRASRQLLQSLRAWPEVPFSTAVQQMQVWGDSGGGVDFAAPAAKPGGDFDAESAALAWIVDVPALEQQLLQAVRFQAKIETVSQAAPAALDVVCEGRHSSSRGALPANWSVKAYPQKAIAARLKSSAAHHGVARQWFKDRDIVALLPMDGDGGHGLALVWSTPFDRAETLENLPPEAFCATLQAICGDTPGALTLHSARAGWPLTLSKAEHWVGPGWALAGDAAHTVHPLAGQGLNLGLADAACLAKVIEAREDWRALGDEKLLRRYERARKAEVAAMAAATDGLQGLFSQTDSRLQALRNWGMNQFGQSRLLKDWVSRLATG